MIPNAGASSAAAAYAIIANAIKASGVIVQVENRDFLGLLDRAENPFVVMTQKSFFSPKHKYLFGHKGLAFFTKSAEPLRLPSKAEVIAAEKIWIPS